LKGIDTEIATKASKDLRVERLIGFTGIDFYTAMVLIYEIGDVTRFSQSEETRSLGWTRSFFTPSIRKGQQNWLDYKARETDG
jgi:hypothetical protein